MRDILVENLDCRRADVVRARAAAGARPASSGLAADRAPRPQVPAVRPRAFRPGCSRRTARTCSRPSARHDILLHHPFDASRRWWTSSGRRARPGRPRHQADALPRRPELAGRRGAARGGAERQAGGGAGRAQGALRRGEQHRVGARARGRGRARDLRPPRPQDALQDRARRAARGRAARAATSTSRPATTTPSRPRSTPTSASSPATRTSARTRRASSTTSPATRAQRDFRKLLVAPIDLRERLLALIEREMEHQRAGTRRPPRVQDERARRPSMIQALVRARRRPACGSTCSCAASAACGPGSPA